MEERKRKIKGKSDEIKLIQIYNLEWEVVNLMNGSAL